MPNKGSIQNGVVKISDNPHEISEDNRAKAATKATAPRALFGMAASFRVRATTGGEVATTKPPTITSAICMVNDQGPEPPAELHDEFPGLDAARPRAKKNDHECREGKDERVGKPAFARVGDAHPETCQ